MDSEARADVVMDVPSSDDTTPEPNPKLKTKTKNWEHAPAYLVLHHAPHPDTEDACGCHQRRCATGGNAQLRDEDRARVQPPLGGLHERTKAHVSFMSMR